MDFGDVTYADLQGLTFTGALKDNQLNRGYLNVTHVNMRNAAFEPGSTIELTQNLMDPVHYQEVGSYGSGGIPQSDWSGVNARDCNLNIQFSNVPMSGAVLSGATIQSGSVLAQCNLADADLCYVSAAGVNFSGTDMSNADLSYADLTGADLSGVNLSGANLTGAILTDAKLKNAVIHNTNMTGVEGISTIPSGAYREDNSMGENNTVLPATKITQAERDMIQLAKRSGANIGYVDILTSN